jgi:hypothetical protein
MEGGVNLAALLAGTHVGYTGGRLGESGRQFCLLAAAAEMRRDNRDAIGACEQAAVKAGAEAANIGKVADAAEWINASQISSVGQGNPRIGAPIARACIRGRREGAAEACCCVEPAADFFLRSDQHRLIRRGQNATTSPANLVRSCASELKQLSPVDAAVRRSDRDLHRPESGHGL